MRLIFNSTATASMFLNNFFKDLFIIFLLFEKIVRVTNSSDLIFFTLISFFFIGSNSIIIESTLGLGKKQFF